MVAGEKEVMTAFRKLRDKIRAFVETMPESLEKLAKEGRKAEE